MNWLQRLSSTELEIITGDGKSFKPLWKNARKNVKYNAEGFDFIDINGTYVERKKQSGNQFPIEIYFHGEDCIEEATRFEYSARDPRPWTIKHPFYDALLVQPLNLEFDNTSYNTSKITGVLWETINWKYPQEKLNVKIAVLQIKSDLDLRTEDVFANKMTVENPDTTEALGVSVDILDKNYEILTDILEDIEVLKDLVRKASGAVQGILDDTAYYMRQMINLVNWPFLIEQTINFKIQKVIESFNQLKDLFIDDEENEEKYVLFESLSTTLVSEACQISTAPGDSDYNTRQEVLNTIDSLADFWASIVSTYDDISFEPDADMYFQTDNLVNNTLANLYEIAFNAKQERSIFLEKDDNIINLAHRFFGPGDDKLDAFVDQNNISLNEMTQVSKGRNIIWFV
jgi:hypothetical protein